MLINFESVFKREKSLLDLANEYNCSDLADALGSYLDFTLGIINTVSDEQAILIPSDPDADDPIAVNPAERYEGWNLVHLVMHVTASAEEGAAFSSILARGISIGGRLRSERDWHLRTTRADIVARLEECRRICLSYLATWPDTPDLTAIRIMPEPYSWMKPNAPISFLVGLMHWHKHIQQFEKVAEQARLSYFDAELHQDIEASPIRQELSGL